MTNTRIYHLYVNGEAVVVNEEVYRAYYQNVEHARYQRKRAMTHEASLNRLEDAGMPVEAHLASTPADALALKERHDALYAALAKIDPLIRDGLWRLVLGEITERALAVEWQISRAKVHRIKVATLAQLRQMLENEI